MGAPNTAKPEDAVTCRFGDSACPCNDGLLCNYIDDPVTGTKAMKPLIRPIACQDCGKPLQQVNAGTEDFIVPLANDAIYLEGRSDGPVICRACADKRGLTVWS